MAGLNYVSWKLNEKNAELPGAYVSEETRRIPVLPGTYTIVLDYSGMKDTTQVKVIPHTGRTHQIRVHAGQIGLKLAGDDQYGDRQANRIWRQLAGLSRQALHAWRLRLPLGGKKRAQATSLMPQDMACLLDRVIPDWQQVLKNA